MDLDLPRGEILVLLGANGAGKSTLLRILATTIRPDGGEAYVNGFDIRRQGAEVRASVGTMFGEDRGWYWRISARRNIDFFGRIAGLDREPLRDRCAALLDEFELTEHADKPVGTYSSGMRARLGLVRALLHDPPVLLLDEPSSHLDPMAALDLRRRLIQLGRRGTSVLIATHDLHEAAEIGDRTVGLVAGAAAFEIAGGSTAADLEQRLVAASG